MGLFLLLQGKLHTKCNCLKNKKLRHFFLIERNLSKVAENMTRLYTTSKMGFLIYRIHSNKRTVRLTFQNH